MAINRSLQHVSVPQIPSTMTGELAVWCRAVTDYLNSNDSHLRLGTSSIGTAVRGDPALDLAGIDPKLIAYNSTAATDEKVWDHTWGGNSGTAGLQFRSRNDVDTNGMAWLNVKRSGLTITQVDFPSNGIVTTSASSIRIAEAGAGGGLAGNASGTTGDIAWGSSSNVSYLYVCVSTDSWMRAALSPF